MRALRFHEFGGLEVLKAEGGVPVPEPGPGQIQVRVAGAGLNPVDWKIRENLYPQFAPKDLPAIIGQEFSGRVSLLGEGVTDFAVGDEVFGSAIGACADYVVADSQAVAKISQKAGLVPSAGIPVAAITAWQALFDNGHLESGQKVFWQAAAGGVGTFAVQLAHWKGAYVAGTASAQNHNLLKELGLDEPIDYNTTQYEYVLKDYDLAVETQHQNFAKTFSIVKPGGTVVSLIGPTDAVEGKNLVPMSATVTRAGLEEIVRLIDAEKLHVEVSMVARFEEGVELYRTLQEGHAVGKLILDMS